MSNSKKSKYSSDYFAKLNDPRWQKKRLVIMERDNFKCTFCGDDKTKLNVHHEYYISLRDPWAYPDHALTTLCEPCHKRERDLDDDYNPNSPRDWEAILMAFKPHYNAFDFGFIFMEYTKASGKTGEDVIEMLREFLVEKGGMI